MNTNILSSIQQDVSLLPYHTFGTQAAARYFAVATLPDHLAELNEYANKYKLPLLLLGGGSNLLFTQDYEGLVVHQQLKGIGIVQQTEEWVEIRAMGGENWHGFVQYCVANNWGGVENLALIPGSVGAAPLQNIGAYGAEVKDTLVAVEALHLPSGEWHMLSATDCDFGYRQSVFKTRFRGQYAIAAVRFRLQKQPVLQTTYGDVQRVFEELVRAGKPASIATVSEAIVQIRQAKLPNPMVLGNAGSFFKNPEISRFSFEQLLSRYAHMPSYPTSSADQVKVPAAWLIEQCGWRGKRVGNTGCHEHQALVIVNYGNATGSEIAQFARHVQESVEQTFGILLLPEVNIL